MEKIIRKIEVFGDSILKGIQVNAANKRYHIDNNIDTEMLSRKFSLTIVNRSKLGHTVTKGKTVVDKFLENGADCAAIVMDYGGNDCDFNWKSISENPDAHHEPHTPHNAFVRIYTAIIERIKQKGIRPIVTNLPPLEPQRYFEWISKHLSGENILRWLDGTNTIYRFQEYYSRTIEGIARSTGALLVDLRGAFLRERLLGQYLCEDGIHPNTEGQRVITQEFARFCATTLGVV